MKVVGFKRGATPTGGAAVAVACNYGLVWVDAHNFFPGRRSPASRRETIRAAQAAPYGRSYYCSVGGHCYEQTRLLETLA